jgi:lysophospholipase L1-like esterase
VPYTRNTSGTTATGILNALTDLAEGADNSPYVQSTSGCTIDGILAALTDLVRSTNSQPYERNTSGTTLDAILDALTDLVNGDDNSPYAGNTTGTTLNGVLDALSDCVTGADRRPYTANTSGVTVNGWLEALTDIVANGGLGQGIELSGSRTLAENSSNGTSVGTLSVSGGTGTYTFTLSDTAGNRFKVAGTNGVNLQAGATPSDRETAAFYNITVHADNGAGSTFDRTFAISITDVNEATPVITSNGGGSTASISVAENTTAVTTVTATDADATAALTYSISGGADAAKFTIGSSSGILAFATAPNFEAPTDANSDNAYVVIVQISDGTNTDTQTITVTVTDANEFAPAITSDGGGSTADITIDENTTAVTTVTATDADPSATIAYSIVGGADAALFTINSSSGVLAFADAPDFESPADANADNIYVVIVQASDGTNTDTQTISVTVTDADESGFPEVRNYVAVGDSITDSSRGGTAAGGGYANAAYHLASPAIATFVNRGLSGAGMSTLIDEAATTDGLLQSGQANILSVFIGANNHPDAAFLADLAGYCDDRRAAGWYVLLGTLLPQTASGTFNAARATANPEMRLWTTSGSIIPGKHADRIFDFDADPVMGADATASNLTYFADGLHPTPAGQARMRDIFLPVLDAAMSNATTDPVILLDSYTTETGGRDTLIQLRADHGVTWAISGDAEITLQETSQLLLDASAAGTFTTTITMTDGDGRTSDQVFAWTVADPPSGYGPNLVINGKGLLGWTGFPVDETLYFEPSPIFPQAISIVDKVGGGKEFKIQGDGGGFPQGPTVTLPAENGATYRADCISRIGTATGGPLMRVDGATSAFLGATTTSVAPYTGTMTSGGTTISFILYIASGAESGNAYWSDLAVRKVL